MHSIDDFGKAIQNMGLCQLSLKKTSLHFHFTREALSTILGEKTIEFKHMGH